MSKNLFLIVFAMLSLILFSNTVFALSQCPNEISFNYENGAFVGSNQAWSETAKLPGEIYFNNNKSSCGLNKGNQITVFAKYPITGADGLPTETKKPLLRITMTAYNEDKLSKAPWNYSYDNDTWNFKFELLKPDGTALNLTEKEIWEYSSLATAAGNTYLDVLLPNGKKAFFVEVRMDSDYFWDGQLDALHIKADPDVSTVLKSLASASGVAPPAMPDFAITPSPFIKNGVNASKQITISFKPDFAISEGYKIYISQKPVSKTSAAEEISSLLQTEGANWWQKMGFLLSSSGSVASGAQKQETISDVSAIKSKPDGKYLLIVYANKENKLIGGFLEIKSGEEKQSGNILEALVNLAKRLFKGLGLE